MDKPTNTDLADFLLWKEFTKDIDPMRQTDWAQEEEMFSDNLPQEKSFKDRASETVRPVFKEPEKTASAIHFQLDRRTDEKLRKGKMPIDGTLDLHGLNQTQAHKALENAILRAVNQEKRCLLVITGKGNTGKTSENWLSPSKGVLKLRVPEWLEAPPMSYHVLKFVTARPNHGGSGALYVYLRRNR